MFKDILVTILNDIQSHKRDKTLLMQMYIEDRLNKSLITYYKEISESVEFLNSKDPIKMNRRLYRGDEDDIWFITRYGGCYYHS